MRAAPVLGIGKRIPERPALGRPRIVVVATRSSRVPALLESQLGELASLLVVHPGRIAVMVGPADLVVVDAQREMEIDWTRVLGSDPDQYPPTWVLVAERAIPVGWIRVLKAPVVHLLQIDPTDDRRGVRGLVQELLGRLQGPSTTELARAITAQVPILTELESLIELICRKPWTIRRPRDLAIARVASHASIRRECRNAGFVRIEHFIHSVRLLCLEQLVSRYRVPYVRALSLAGLEDPSNLRRQLKRAIQGSPVVRRVLAQGS